MIDAEIDESKVELRITSKLLTVIHCNIDVHHYTTAIQCRHSSTSFVEGNDTDMCIKKH